MMPQNILFKYFITLVVILIFSPFAQAQDTPEEPPKKKVRVANAVMTQMAPILEVPGSVVSLHNSRLAAETSATVDWVAEVGTFVEEGQPVARLNQRLLQLDLINAKADIKRIIAQLDFRTKAVKRLTKLLNSQSIPESRYDESISQKVMLEQELKQASARRARIEYLLEKSTIKAPFSGWVVECFISIGEYVQSGAHAVRFVDSQNTEISVQAPLGIITNLKQGMKITVSNGEQTAMTNIRAIIPIGDNISRMVEIRLKNPENMWIIGSAVRVSLPKAAAKNVLTIPRDALIIRTGQSYIYKVAQDGKAERVNIRTGATSATHIEVTGNLVEGDQVITRGGETLQPGQEVEILPLS